MNPPGQARRWWWWLLAAVAAVALLPHLAAWLTANRLALYRFDLSVPAAARDERLVTLHQGGLSAFPGLSAGGAPALFALAVTDRQLQRAAQPLPPRACDSSPALCRVEAGRLALTGAGHAALARAAEGGQVRGHTRAEWEVLAYSCLQATSAAPGCRQRIAQGAPDLAPLLMGDGLYVAASVPELTQASGADLPSLLDDGHVACDDALRFLRGWVNASGFLAAQAPAAEAAAQHCAGQPELELYRARALDLAGLAAGTAYDAAGFEQHPEAAFWRLDYLARRGQCAGAVAAAQALTARWPAAAGGLYLSAAWQQCAHAPPAACTGATQVWPAEDLLAQASDGSDLGRQNIVADAAAADGQARHSSAFGTVLAYGPYVDLPYGRYRATFVLRAQPLAGYSPVARLVVRSDYADWRTYLWSTEAVSAAASGEAYRRLSYEFTHPGEGAVSVAVVALTSQPVWVDQVEITNASCP